MAVGDQVRLPVVEVPVPDPGDVAADRQQVERTERDAGGRDGGELCREGPPRHTATGDYATPVNARADRFPLIDSLRAIAALAVLTTHAAFFAGAYGGGPAPDRPAGLPAHARGLLRGRLRRAHRARPIRAAPRRRRDGVLPHLGLPA